MTAIKTGAQPLRQRLAPRLIGLVMLTALVTGGLLGLMLIQSSRSIMREEILAKNLATADLVAKFAANYIEGAQTNVRQFAARPLFIRAVLERDLTTAETHLAQFLEINPRFDIISVYDAQGFGWASGMKGNWPNRGGSVADRDYFQGNMESKAPYLGIPVYSRSTGNAVIPYSVPIFDDRGEINAIVSGGLLLEALSEAAAGLGANSFARASLLDARQNGIIVTHSDPQRLLTPVTGQNAASLHALAGERGTMETPDSRGDLSLAAFSPVPGLPWAALIMEPVETAFAPLNRLTVKAGFCLGAVMLIATALGIWFVRKITRPVQELIEGTEAISQGNLDHVIPVRGRDEIGRLADAFNAMTTSLKLSRGENARLLQETRQSEERLRYLISSCPVAIYTTRSGGDYGATFITPNVVALVGYEPHEFTADPGFWADHLHPEDAPRVFAALSRLHVDGHHADEYRFLCKDGTYRWMRDEAVLINDEQGVARELVGSWIDITGRKRMEEALREERDKLEERVFERTQVLQESERRLALLGRLREELIGAADLSAKLKRITDGIVEIFDAELARVWVTGEADRCDEGCCHAAVSEGSAACRDRSRCLHLVASSGRYTDLDGDHGRVPLGCYKIGKVASGDNPEFITNEVASDPQVHDHEWARSLGLISFAGFRLLSKKGRPLGVMALFSRHPIQPQDEVHLRGFATTTSQVILEGMAEEALARSEEKYRSLFANAQVGMYRTSLDGSALREANQKLADIFGYSVAELLSAPTAVDMLWASPDAYHELLRRLFEKGLVTDYEFQIITKRGEVRTCLTSIKLFRQEGYLEGSMIDITERKRTEEALHRANQMLRVVLDTIPARVFWKDRQLRYLGGNRLFVADAGYADPTELVGKDDFAILGKETAEHYRAQDESVMASDTPALASEEMAAGPDGTQRWLRVNKVPLHDSQGAVIGLLGTYEDITERKAATEALSAAKERLERASTAGKVALWEWDIESGTLEWSGAIDAMLGFGKGEFTRTVQAWNAILHPDDRLRVLEALKRHLRDNEPFEMDYRICRADGASLWWHTTGSSQRDGDGRAIRMTGACTDVTERKKAEEERLALERRLQQARKTESLGRMAGAVAHHFNNKLGAILGSLELAQADLPPESKIGKHLSRAMTASFQAAKISRLMLAYLGHAVGKKEPLDLGQTIRETLIVLTAMLPDQVHLRADDIPAQGPKILADGGQITLILNNLVTNAMEAVGDQAGEITVAVRVRPATELRKWRYYRADWGLTAEYYACLSVADTGCGLDEAVHDRIFDPFYTTKFTGRGLGLAVVFGIVKAHEGAITFESQPGQGATFHVFFPLLP